MEWQDVKEKIFALASDTDKNKIQWFKYFSWKSMSIQKIVLCSLNV